MTYLNSDDTDPAASGVVERPLLIGRDKELAQVEAILEHHGPALVVVSAPTGAGKSSLLQEIYARATEQGWRAAYSDSEGPFSVAPSTTERTFGQRMLELLGVFTSEAFSPTMTSQVWADPLHSLLDQLDRREHVLLIIDGYEPEPRFAHWYTSSFIEGVRYAEAPVAVIVSDQSSNLAELRPIADEVIDLGPLDQQAVRQHLELIGRQIAPPMEASELDAYVKFACKDPGKLAFLKRVLTLAQPDKRSTSPATAQREER